MQENLPFSGGRSNVFSGSLHRFPVAEQMPVWRMRILRADKAQQNCTA